MTNYENSENPSNSINEPDIQLELMNWTLSHKEQINFQGNNWSDKILCGDCEDILSKLPDNSIDLIVTSPPYADQRKSTYGGISADKYVDWFMPKANQFLRVLKPTGSFILNIKERVVDGERHTYVMELVIEMRRHGWLWTEE